MDGVVEPSGADHLSVSHPGDDICGRLLQLNLSSGDQQDRGNRWVFIAFGLVAFLSAIVPPYTDRIGLWTIDGEQLAGWHAPGPGA